MELVHYHGMEPLDRDVIGAALRARVPAGNLHHRGVLEVALASSWSPSDTWPEAIVRRCWSASFTEPRRGWLTDAGEARLARQGFAARQAPVTPAEVLAQQLGGGMVLVFSDAARLCYVAVYRDRRFAWSLMLQDGARLVRAYGDEVSVFEPPPRLFPEGDRLGVLAAGLQQWLREPVGADEGDARLLLPEALAGCFDEQATHRLCEGGVWSDAAPLAPGRRLA